MSIYRISILRCLGFILAGVLIEKYENRLKTEHILLLFLGGLICALTNVFISDNYMFNNYIYTSIPIILWPVALTLSMMKLPEKMSESKLMGVICSFGKATYHILLVQMLYYYFLKKNVIGAIPLAAVIAVSILVGTLWHIADSKLQRKILKK